MDTRISNLDNNLSGVYTRLGGVENRLNNFLDSGESIEDGIQEMADTLVQAIDDVDTHVSRVEESLGDLEDSVLEKKNAYTINGGLLFEGSGDISHYEDNTEIDLGLKSYFGLDADEEVPVTDVNLKLWLVDQNHTILYDFDSFTPMWEQTGEYSFYFFKNYGYDWHDPRISDVRIDFIKQGDELTNPTIYFKIDSKSGMNDDHCYLIAECTFGDSDVSSKFAGAVNSVLDVANVKQTLGEFEAVKRTIYETEESLYNLNSELSDMSFFDSYPSLVDTVNNPDTGILERLNDFDNTGESIETVVGDLSAKVPSTSPSDAYYYLKVDSDGTIIAQEPIDYLGDGEFGGDGSDIPNAQTIQDLIYMIDE